MPGWLYKFVGEEWGDDFQPFQEQGKREAEIIYYVIEFYKSKGITAWHEGYSICLDIDLDTPEWTFRMLKYEGATC
jgi:hypothetical protein